MDYDDSKNVELEYSNSEDYDDSENVELECSNSEDYGDSKNVELECSNSEGYDDSENVGLEYSDSEDYGDSGDSGDYGDFSPGNIMNIIRGVRAMAKFAKLTYVESDTLNCVAGEIAHKKNLDECDSGISTIVNVHCGIAAAAAITPLPGAAMVATIANIAAMYSRINEKIGITVDDSVGKLIVKTIVGGLTVFCTSFCTSFAAGEALKFIPVIGSYAGAAVSGTAAVYITRASAFLYIKIINLVTSDMSQENLDSLVKETINENRDELKAMYEEEKRNQKNK